MAENARHVTVRVHIDTSALRALLTEAAAAIQALSERLGELDETLETATED